MKKRPKLKKLIGLRSEPQGLHYEDLDAKMERPVLDVLASRDATGASISEIGVECFYGTDRRSGKRAKNHAQANSWARNALRRPIREGLIERVDIGVYRLTRKGRNSCT